MHPVSKESIVDQLKKKMFEALCQFRTDFIARACHQSWYAYSVLALGEEGKCWADAPDFQKSSITSAVIFWDHYMDEHPEGIDLKQLCEASHVNWCRYKKEEGWAYGPAKREDLKQHPCLVNYEQLPESQRKKDEVVVCTYLELRKLFDSFIH